MAYKTKKYIKNTLGIVPEVRPYEMKTYIIENKMLIVKGASGLPKKIPLNEHTSVEPDTDKSIGSIIHGRLGFGDLIIKNSSGEHRIEGLKNIQEFLDAIELEIYGNSNQANSENENSNNLNSSKHNKRAFLNTLNEVTASKTGGEVVDGSVVGGGAPLIGKIIFFGVIILSLPDTIKGDWWKQDEILLYNLVGLFVILFLSPLMIAGIATMVIILLISIYKHFFE